MEDMELSRYLHITPVIKPLRQQEETLKLYRYLPIPYNLRVSIMLVQPVPEKKASGVYQDITC